VHIEKSQSPLLFNLDKAVVRAKESRDRKTSTSMSIRNPTHKNEENGAEKEVLASANNNVGEGDSDSSVASINSKRSYVSMASSKSKNSEKADMFDKQHEVKTAEERRILLQHQLQKNLVKNSIIR
jgi:hypothetical protein